MNVEKVDVLQIMNSSKVQVSQLAKEKKIEIKLEQNIDTINVDRNLLLRILVNLISNAIKVSSDGTEIKVSASKLNQHSVIFSVKDQGPGFSKKLEKKLFTKYYQGSKIMIGSGIGLSFCKLAVEAHNGTISLDSIVGKGTTVSFIIPQ
jgi:signal transduction histidine kinase